MAKAKRIAKREPEEEPDTAQNAHDDLDRCIGDARAIIGVLGDAADVRASLDNEEISTVLYLAYHLLKDADDAAERLRKFARGSA